MENIKFVSVIIPNYNHAPYLDERIQSVLNQTYQNFELIILDDHSTDNSVEVINKYKDDPHVSHIVVNEHNSGSTFKQWHKGFELAKGELIWIAESDDSCESILLETLVQGYVENNAVLAFCRSCKYDVFGKKYLYDLQTGLLSDVVLQGKDFISNYMVSRNLVANASSAIFNRSVAMSIDRQYMAMRGEGDYLFWVELMEYGNVYFCSRELNFFRFHESNTTKCLAIKGVGRIEHKILFDYFVQKGYLSGSSYRTEMKNQIAQCLYVKYESRTVKRKVLKLWDNSRFWRLYLAGSKIKSGLRILIEDMW